MTKLTKMNKLTLLASAILLASVPLSAPAAQARPITHQMTVVFRYNGEAAPEQIHRDLAHTAHKACTPNSVSPIAFRQHQRSCAANLLDKAVARIGRADIAAVHETRSGDMTVRVSY